MSANAPFIDASTSPAASPVPPSAPGGLTSAEVSRRLLKDGPNAMPDTSAHPLRDLLAAFWAPVPWLLESAIVLQLVSHKYLEAAVILGLLLFNAGLAFVQEGRAQATLAALKSRLALNASVRRDGVWRTVPATELVCGDLVKLSLGCVVAADVHLIQGSVSLDQSMLTGESLPREAGAGMDTYAGALVRRGEATAEVTATGRRTKFGRSAELVGAAHVVSSQQKAVLRVVRNLAIFNGSIVVLIGVYAYSHSMPQSEIISLLLASVLAAIPVALPATFTLAASVGARALAKLGVLPTRLSAVDEAASIDVLCSDKTGTLTRNQLSVATSRPMPGFDEAHLLGMATLASAEGGQDSVDQAIRAASAKNPASDLPALMKFVPFDPSRKMSEATTKSANGCVERVVKGAFTTIAELAPPPAATAAIAREIEGQGYRVLAVAAGPPAAMQLMGLIALSDPPRADSASLITELQALGVRTVMVTGDAPATAANLAHAIGLEGLVCPAGALPKDLKPSDCAVFASILPEGKFDLVKSFQKNGHTVGMCGDGANDSPALRQAQMGIAVSTATDVAKSAAGIVLTTPGLGGIVAAVKEGRITFQRILSYILNSVIKKIGLVLLLAAGLIITGHAVLTPLLMVIVLITGDFLVMTLTTDRVRPSEKPNAWQIGRITSSGVILGACFLAFCTTVLAVGKFRMGLGLEELRTLSVVAVVFGGQSTLYAVRGRRHYWGLRPTRWMLLSSLADVSIISTLAFYGIVMAPLPLSVIAGEFGASLIFGLLLAGVKLSVFGRLGLQ
jgi:H+-transporting ATPase